MRRSRFSFLFVSTRSMRRALAIYLVVIFGLLSVLDLALEYPGAARAMDEARDRALIRVAAGYLRSLRAKDVDATSIPTSVFREEIGTTPAPALRLRISDERGVWLGGDRALSPHGLVGADAVLQPKIYDDTVDGQHLRVVTVRDLLASSAGATPVIVQVAEPMGARSIAHRALLFSLVGSISLRLVVVLIAAWLVVMAAWQPLMRLGAHLRMRRPQDLSLIEITRPAELLPFVEVVNTLIREQQHVTDQQRKFLADASHQLRTPLAVLRTQVQGMLGNPTTAGQTLPQMLATIDRATRLANQLLSMAKVEQFVRRADWGGVDLDQVARNLSLEFAPLIARKRLDFSLQSGTLRLQTDAWLLGELVRNLLSNAIHHSPKGSALGIVVRTLRHEAEMIVWDHGGGVDEDVRARLFEPFTAARGGTGIGLGLSICRQIAESMNATVDLFNRIEAGRIVGVDAIVRWPLPVHSTADSTAGGDDPLTGTPAESSSAGGHGTA
jgi:signal transduction histidine kinase